MARLYDGKTVAEISTQEILEALAAGEWWAYETPPKVPMISPEGRRLFKPFESERVRSALSAGWRFETPEEEKKRWRKEEFGDRPLAAGVAGLARGLTFGLSDAALAKGEIVDPRVLQAIKEENEAVSYAGEILGAVGPVVASGGTGAIARGIAGAGAIPRAATALAERTAARLGGGLGGRAVGYGLEGAVFGAGQAISEAALEDRDLAAEQMLAHMGLGATLGGGFAGVGHLIGKGKDVIKRRFARPKPKRVGPEPGIFEKTAAFGKPFDAEDLAEFTRGPDAKWARQHLHDTAETIDKNSEEIFEILRGIKKNEDVILDNWSIGKAEQVQKAIPEEIAEDAFQETSNLMGTIQSRLKEMLDAGEGEFDRKYLQKLTKRLEAVGKHIEKVNPENKVLPKSAKAGVFIELDGLKKDIGKMVVALKRSRTPLRPLFRTTQAVERMFYELRDFLQKESLWGAMATRQRAINAAWHKWFNAQEHTIRAAMWRRAGKKPDTFDFIYEPDLAGIKKVLSRSAVPEGRQDIENYLMQLQFSRELVGEMTKHLDLDKAILAKGDDIIKGYGNIIEIAKKTRSIAESKGKFDALMKKAGFGAGRDPLGSYGSAFGLGLLFGSPAAGIGIRAGLDIISNPERLIKARIMIDRLNERMRNKTKSAIQTYLKPSAAAKAAAKAAPKRATRKEVFSEYERAREDLDGLVSPESLQDRLTTALEDMDLPSQEAEGLVMATTRAVDHLRQTAPLAASRAGLLGIQDQQENMSQIQQWMDRMQVIENPLSILDDLQAGTLTLAKVITLRAVYPEIYSRIVQQAAELIANADIKDLPYQKRIQLTMLLGMPLDATLQNETMATMQESYMKEDKRQAPRVAPSRASDITVADRTQTVASKLESRAGGT